MTTNTIAIILGAILILSNGAQYYLNETGKNIACKTGWQFQETGENEGQYLCQLATSQKLEYCASISNSANTMNYWCKQATPVFIESTNSIDKPKAETCTNIECTPCPNTGCAEKIRR